MNNKSLVLDLVEWVAAAPRSYAEVMQAWRTSCPRLTIWEDALDCGFVKRAWGDSAGSIVTTTSAGLAFLASEGRGELSPAGAVKP